MALELVLLHWLVDGTASHTQVNVSIPMPRQDIHVV